MERQTDEDELGFTYEKVDKYLHKRLMKENRMRNLKIRI